MADETLEPMDDSLIGKYLAGEASAEEVERVRRWLGESPAEQSELSRLTRIWDESARLNQPIPVDTNAAWQKVKRQMREAEPDSEAAIRRLPSGDSIIESDANATTPVRPLYPASTDKSAVERPLHQPIQRWAWTAIPVWRYAAVLLIFMGLGWVAYQSLRPKPIAMQSIATRQSKTTVTLPDGSQVVLNRNSRLNYPEQFTDSTRQVTLTGEAFFEVRPDAEHPFVIKARETTIRVLGTSFSVRAYTDTVRVAVVTGKVQFGTSRKRIVLTPNQEATYEAGLDTLRKALRMSPNVMAFRTNRLAFDRTTLAEVARTLTDVYGTPVRLANESIHNCLYTATFANEKLETILDVVAASLKLRVERTTDGFVLAGDGCQ